MKKSKLVILGAVMILVLSSCGNKHEENNPTYLNDVMEQSDSGTNNNTEIIENSTKEENTQVEETSKLEEIETENVVIKPSPDKYTWYIKNYVGKNCASLGYTSLGGDRFDKYGMGLLELIFISVDGSYVDIDSEDVLREYVVIGQSLKPNTELKLSFLKDDEGKEYDGLIDNQSYEEIVLCVKKIGTDGKSFDFTEINPSPDKYTWYIADYVGRNLKDCGYVSLGGNLMDEYGEAVVELILVSEDGSYIDPTDEEALKSYVVTSQNIQPNTELKLEFMKDSNGKEYGSLIDTQSIEEIEVYVKKIN